MCLRVCILGVAAKRNVDAVSESAWALAHTCPVLPAAELPPRTPLAHISEVVRI